MQGYLTYKKTLPLGPFRTLMPMLLGGSLQVGRFLMGEAPLKSCCSVLEGGIFLLARYSCNCTAEGGRREVEEVAGTRVVLGLITCTTKAAATGVPR